MHFSFASQKARKGGRRARVLCYLARMGFPALDLARFESASPAGRRTVGAEVDAICRATGFLGHGVPQAIIDALWSRAEAFYAFPGASPKYESVRSRPYLMSKFQSTTT
jgi:isopenicillin N synthase-like dioxygenase